MVIEELYSSAFLRGVESFNRGAYFNAHDCWEECWIAKGRPADGLMKGLIQAAVAMHHLSRGNLTGAEKLLARLRKCLAPCRPNQFGFNVEKLVDEMAACLSQSSVNSPITLRFDVRRGPQIQLDQPVCASSE